MSFLELSSFDATLIDWLYVQFFNAVECLRRQKLAEKRDLIVFSKYLGSIIAIYLCGDYDQRLLKSYTLTRSTQHY